MSQSAWCLLLAIFTSSPPVAPNHLAYTVSHTTARPYVFNPNKRQIDMRLLFYINVCVCMCAIVCSLLRLLHIYIYIICYSFACFILYAVSPLTHSVSFDLVSALRLLFVLYTLIYCANRIYVCCVLIVCKYALRISSTNTRIRLYWCVCVPICANVQTLWL